MQRKSDDFPSGDYVRKVWIAVSIAAFMVALLFVVWYGLEILLVIFAGVLLGLFLLAPADWLRDHSPLSRRWAMLVVVIAVIALIGVFVIGLATTLNAHVQQLMEILPNSLSELKSQARTWPLGPQIVDRLEEGQADGNALGNWLSQITSVLSSTFGAAVTFFFIIFLALFVAFEPGTYRKGLLLLMPPAKRPMADDLMITLRHKLNWWMLGRLVSMSLIGIATGIGLWLIGMPAYLPLALLAAALVFIPNLGPLLSALPALLIASTEGLLLPVAILYLSVQAVESNLITPMIDRQSVKLPPALLLSAQLSLGLVGGIMGLLLAAPLTVLAMLVVKRVYVDRWQETGI